MSYTNINSLLWPEWKEGEERLGGMDGWGLNTERLCRGLCGVSWGCHYLWLQARVP